MSYYGFKPYVPVAKRRAQAAKKMQKLQKQGMDIKPVEIEKRKIARTFWGNAWCEHIEAWHDFANRLPRGRTYVRNGSVCHLDIQTGKIIAFVSGSSLYQVEITVKALAKNKWQHIKTYCSGKIGSLLDLLSGQLADGVMAVVCNQKQGLFPQANEITLACNCPDWASMCKHIAAVLYGVGARLDHRPEKLFELRGVDQSELIDVSNVMIDTEVTGPSKRRLATTAIGNVFDIDLNDKTTDLPTTTQAKKSISNKKPKQTKNKTSATKKKQKTNITENTKQAKANQKVLAKTKTKKNLPAYFSGANIRKKRQQLQLTQTALAKALGCSAATISNWEKRGRQKITLKDSIAAKLTQLW